MELVIDANILFSALIKNSTIANLLFDSNFKIYSPEYVVEEFLKYNELIANKTRRTREDFISIMHVLKEIITVVPEEEYSEYIAKGKAISPDEKDAMYFALALKLKCAIWSSDRKLKEQNEIEVYSTEDLIGMN